MISIIDKQKFTNKVIEDLSRRGYKVFSNLPIVENNLSFIAIAPNEIVLIGETLYGDFTENDLTKAILKLICFRVALALKFIDTLDNTIKISMSMVIVCSKKTKLLSDIKSPLFYSGIQIVVFSNRSHDLDETLPKIDIDLLKDKEEKETFKAYVHYIRTIINVFKKEYSGMTAIEVIGNILSNLMGIDFNGRLPNNILSKLNDIFPNSNINLENSLSNLLKCIEKKFLNKSDDSDNLDDQDELDDQIDMNDLDDLDEPDELDESEKKSTVKPRHFKSPREMADEVKKYVIGQDSAIERVATPFFLHVESRQTRTTCYDIKTPFILIGNTGTGKTEILRRFGEISNVPIIHINTADCVPNTWKGTRISDLIGYYINDISDLEKMKYAVLVFNEFDKITHYNQRLVGTNGSDCDFDMQREFLKFFDKGYELVIEKQKNFETKTFHLPTDNLLLCFDGAFSGMEKIIENRLKLNSGSIGFIKQGKTRTKKDISSYLMQQITAEDLKVWGYLPELLDRINTFITMNPMTEELVYQVLTRGSDNICKAHQLQCSKYGIKLEFTEEAYRKIAKMVVESGFGLRSVRRIFSDLMSDIYYNLDKYKNETVTVDEKFIELKFGPVK